MKRGRVLLLVGSNEIGVRWAGDGVEGELTIMGPFSLECMTDRPPPMDGNLPLQELLHDNGTWLLREVEAEAALKYQHGLLALRLPGAFHHGDEFACFELWATWHRHPQPQSYAPLALLLWERIFMDPAWSAIAPNPCESELVIVVPLSAPLLFAREICRAAEAHGFHVLSVRHILDVSVAGLQLRGCSGRVRLSAGQGGCPDWTVDLDAAPPSVSVAAEDGQTVTDIEDARERTLGLLASAWRWWHADRPDDLGIGPVGTVLGIRIGDGDEEGTETERSTGILWTSMGFPGSSGSDIPSVTQYAKLEIPDHDMRVRVHLVHGIPGMLAVGACSLWRTDPSGVRGAEDALRFRIERLPDVRGCSVEVGGLPSGPIERRIEWDAYGRSLGGAAFVQGTSRVIRADGAAYSGGAVASVGYDLRTGDVVLLRRVRRGDRTVRWRGRIGTILVQTQAEDPPYLASYWPAPEAELALFKLMAARGHAATARRHAWAVSIRKAIIDEGAPLPTSRCELALVVPYRFSLEMYQNMVACLRMGGWDRVELLFRHEAVAMGLTHDRSNVRVLDWSIAVTRTVDAGVTRLCGPTQSHSDAVEIDSDDPDAVLPGALAALAAPRLVREHRVEGLLFVHGALHSVLPLEGGGRRVTRLRRTSRIDGLPLVLRLGTSSDAPWVIGPTVGWPAEESQLVMVGVRKMDGTAGVRILAQGGEITDHLVPEDLLA